MATIPFDTYAFVKKLKSTGLPEEQAEVHAETLSQLIEGELATKRDLKELEVTLRRDIADIKADMLKWIAGLLVAQAGFIIAAIKPL
jgi:hypothetical protein